MHRFETTWLDSLVSSCTSFNTFDAFANAMLGGYVPTIFPTTRRRRLLTAFLIANGWKVFDGKRTYGD